ARTRRDLCALAIDLVSGVRDDAAARTDRHRLLLLAMSLVWLGIEFGFDHRCTQTVPMPKNSERSNRTSLRINLDYKIPQDCATRPKGQAAIPVLQTQSTAVPLSRKLALPCKMK